MNNESSPNDKARVAVVFVADVAAAQELLDIEGDDYDQDDIPAEEYDHDD